MNRYIVPVALFAVLFAFATSAHAQATGSDCSQSDQPTKTWNQQPPDPICGTGGARRRSEPFYCLFDYC